MKKVLQCLAIVLTLSMASLFSVNANSGENVYGPSYVIYISASCGFDIDSSQWENGRQFIVQVTDPKGYIISTKLITDRDIYYVIGTEKGLYTITAFGLRFLDLGYYRYEWHVHKEKTLYVDRFDVTYWVQIHLGI